MYSIPIVSACGPTKCFSNLNHANEFMLTLKALGKASSVSFCSLLGVYQVLY
jgi:hypothetical protein